MKGSVYKRCKCRGDDGREAGASCPRLRRADGAWNPKHGTWYFRLELPAGVGVQRQVMKRGGFDSRDAAEAAQRAVGLLLTIPEPGLVGAAAREEILGLVDDALKRRLPLPDYDELRRRQQTGQALGGTMTVGQWLTEWMAGRRKLKSGTARSYEAHIRLYFLPHLGELPLDKLRVGHVSAMFDAIDAESARIVAVRASGTDEERAELKGRKPVGAATKQRIRATLRKALNDAVRQQLILVNPAAFVELESGKRPKALVWTDERVTAWRANRSRRADAVEELVLAHKARDEGLVAELRQEVERLDATERPSPVMVWTAEQTGAFLDHAANERLYALFHLITFRGLRRGEACGVRWTDLDLDTASLAVAEQLVQIGWAVEADTPKSDAGERTVLLDADTVLVLRAWRRRQVGEKLLWGEGWTDSGRIFTREDGTELHPASITSLFAVLVEEAGLPPIRLHDLRHGAATLALLAGVDIKVVQEMLGHSSSVITRDTYTSVAPRLALEAAEKTAAMVPRKPVAEAASGTDGLPTGSRGSRTPKGVPSRRGNSLVKRGGPPGDRTPNPRIKSPLLCQLS
ncbi:integrase-like protein [Umezawaea tangerina]|uniref:Integrase-like protein n=1 Tax=Umezawaea tangerina TaxID=84725 RepID=A0A2T0TCA8_9PSEU|nr:integrase-like protein [Umezawaea tangerina]